MTDDLYREIILEHYKHPINRGKIEDGIEAGEANMQCGDRLRISAKIEDGKVVDAKFEGGGCAVSMAAVDMLLEKIKGMDEAEVAKIKGSNIEEMLGVELTPARRKCAYLGLEVVKKLIKKGNNNT